MTKAASAGHLGRNCSFVSKRSTNCWSVSTESWPYNKEPRSKEENTGKYTRLRVYRHRSREIFFMPLRPFSCGRVQAYAPLPPRTHFIPVAVTQLLLYTLTLHRLNTRQHFRQPILLYSNPRLSFPHPKRVVPSVLRYIHKKKKYSTFLSCVANTKARASKGNRTAFIPYSSKHSGQP